MDYLGYLDAYKRALDPLKRKKLDPNAPGASRENAIGLAPLVVTDERSRRPAGVGFLNDAGVERSAFGGSDLSEQVDDYVHSREIAPEPDYDALLKARLDARQPVAPRSTRSAAPSLPELRRQAAPSDATSFRSDRTVTGSTLQPWETDRERAEANPEPEDLSPTTRALDAYRREREAEYRNRPALARAAENAAGGFSEAMTLGYVHPLAARIASLHPDVSYEEAMEADRGMRATEASAATTEDRAARLLGGLGGAAVQYGGILRAGKALAGGSEVASAIAATRAGQMGLQGGLMGAMGGAHYSDEPLSFRDRLRDAGISAAQGATFGAVLPAHGTPKAGSSALHAPSVVRDTEYFDRLRNAARSPTRSTEEVLDPLRRAVELAPEPVRPRRVAPMREDVGVEDFRQRSMDEATGPERVTQAAIRDPETGKVYTGANHGLALDKAADDGASWSALQMAWDRGDPNVTGYATNRRPFASREMLDAGLPDDMANVAEEVLGREVTLGPETTLRRPTGRLTADEREWQEYGHLMTPAAQAEATARFGTRAGETPPGGQLGHGEAEIGAVGDANYWASRLRSAGAPSDYDVATTGRYIASFPAEQRAAVFETVSRTLSNEAFHGGWNLGASQAEAPLSRLAPPAGNRGGAGLGSMTALAGTGIGAGIGAAADDDDPLGGALRGGAAGFVVGAALPTAARRALGSGGAREWSPPPPPVDPRYYAAAGDVVVGKPVVFEGSAPGRSAVLAADEIGANGKVGYTLTRADGQTHSFSDLSSAFQAARRLGYDAPTAPRAGRSYSPHALTHREMNIASERADASGAQSLATPPPNPRRAKGDPLPLPPMHPDLVPGAVEPGWREFSARYPRIAGRVKGIDATDPSSFAVAFHEPAAGVIGVPADNPAVSAGTFFHEGAHVAQHVRRQQWRTPEEALTGEHYAQRLQRAYDREPGGNVSLPVRFGAGAVAGAGYGYATGDYPEERLSRAVKFGGLGAALGTVAPGVVGGARRVLGNNIGAVGDDIGRVPMRRGQVPLSMWEGTIPPEYTGSRDLRRAWITGTEAGEAGVASDFNRFTEGSPEWEAAHAGWASQQPKEPLRASARQQGQSRFVVQPSTRGRFQVMDTQAGRVAEEVGGIGAERTARALAVRMERESVTAPEGAGPLAGTRVADESGVPKVAYHGTSRGFVEFDPARVDEGAMYGPGYYFTEDARVAGGDGAVGGYAQTTANRSHPASRAELSSYFTPGRVTEAYGQPERVIEFRDSLWPDWSAELQPVDAARNPVGSPRSTSITPPDVHGEAVAPNVRPARLGIRNPFDIDATYSPDEVMGMVRQSGASPETVASIEVSLPDTAREGRIHGEDAYKRVLQAWTHAGDAQAVNETLRKAGYDGITHIGGGNTGTDPHRVWIAFDRGQIRSAFGPAEDAAQTGAANLRPLTALAGAGTGAAVGAAQDDDNPGRGAVLGGLAGLVGGAAIPDVVRSMRRLSSNELGAIPGDPEQALYDALRGEEVPTADFIELASGRMAPRDFAQRHGVTQHLATEYQKHALSLTDEAGYRSPLDDPAYAYDRPRPDGEMYTPMEPPARVEGHPDDLFLPPDAGSPAYDRNARLAGGGLAKRATLAGLSTAGGAAAGSQLDEEHPLRGAITGAIAGAALGSGWIVPRKGQVPVSPLPQRAATAWKAGLLTALRTHGVNMTSNVGLAIGETAKDAPAVFGDRLLSAVINNRITRKLTGIDAAAPRLLATKGRGDSLPVLTGAAVGGVGGAMVGDTPGERVRNATLGATAGAAVALGAVSWKGALEGVKNAREVIAGRLPSSAIQRFEVPTDTRFGNLWLDLGTRYVFRALGAEDQIFRTVAIHRSLEEQAGLIARTEGLRGKAASTRAGELKASPTDEMALRALADAEVATFQDETRLGNAITEFGKIPVVGTVTAPFGRTPGAVGTRIVEYSPAGFVISGVQTAKLIGALKEGATPEAAAAIQRYAAEAFGRAATGTSVIGLGYVLGRLGMATGAYPAKRNEQAEWQDEGRQENSLRMGGNWVEFGRLAPLGNMLGIGASIARAEEQGHNPVVAGLGAVPQEALDQTFLPGAEQLLDAFADPEGKPGQRYIRNLAGSVIPAGVASVARAMDSTVRKPGSVADQIRSRIPGLSEQVAPKIGPNGQPVTRPHPVLGETVVPMRMGRDLTAGDPLQAQFHGLDFHVPGTVKRAAEGRDAFLRRISGQPEAPQREGETPAQYALRSVRWRQPRPAETDEEFATRERQIRTVTDGILRKVVLDQRPADEYGDLWDQYHQLDQQIKAAAQQDPNGFRGLDLNELIAQQRRAFLSRIVDEVKGRWQDEHPY